MRSGFIGPAGATSATRAPSRNARGRSAPDEAAVPEEAGGFGTGPIIVGATVAREGDYPVYALQKDIRTSRARGAENRKLPWGRT